jgi:hypothetical protein
MKAIPCLAFLLAAFASGCTYYGALTPPPPGRVASLNTSDNELRLSRGVALAFECVTPNGNPCSEGVATIDDPKVAQVYPAHVGKLDRYMQGTFTPASYVVVGLAPGKTLLRIPGEDPLHVIVQE